MRHWLVVLICCVSLTAQAQTGFNPGMLAPSPLGLVLMIGQWIMQDNKRVYYIRVAGEGDTPEQARTNGFRLGVEQAVGTIVLSETQVANRRIQRDEIITYAAGFVDRFEILRTETVNGRYRVSMDLWIGESAIARRLLNDSAGASHIDGQRLAVQVETLQMERHAGDRLLETVLRDFPQRAFAVEVDKTEVRFDERRTLQMSVPVTIGWSREYYAALMEVFRRTRSDAVNCTSVWRALAGIRSDPECLAQAERQTYVNGMASDDPARVMAMIQHFTQNKPALEIAVVDLHGRTVNRGCYNFLFSNLENQPYNIPNHYLFAVHNNNVQINPRYQLSGKLGMNLGGNTAQIQQANRIVVRVVTEKQCFNQ
jgi:hypothetical protein